MSVFSRVFGFTATAFCLAGLVLLVVWQRDTNDIHRQALAIAGNLEKPSERIVAINHWVYGNQGFAKNPDYFVFEKLGPTPIQVMQRGGDCADKGRLVAAMLASLGIRAGLLEVSDCPGCPWIHTVVEAESETGWMIVDPIWDVDYPSGKGKYLGLKELANTSLAWQHVTELQSERGPQSKIAMMPRAEATFDYAVSINWRQSVLTKVVEWALRQFDFDQTFVHRPNILEDPELFLASLSLMLSFSIALLTVGMRYLFKAR